MDNLKYHYTNIDALESILRTKTIWLTYCEDLKDNTEGKYLLEKLKEDLSDYNEIFRRMTQNLYIACFCAYRDLYDQWRDYGSVNIGFDFEAIQSDMKFVSDKCGKLHDTSGISICECVYTTCEDESYKNVLSYVRQEFNDTNGYSIPSQQYSYLSCYQCFILKPKKYITEHETRIFSHLWRKEPVYYNGKRHIEFHFSADKVRSITIGPSLWKSRNRNEIVKYLNELPEYKHVVIQESNIGLIRYGFQWFKDRFQGKHK